MQSMHSQQKSPLPISGLPVNCCGPTGSPGPLGSIATLSAFNQHKVIRRHHRRPQSPTLMAQSTDAGIGIGVGPCGRYYWTGGGQPTTTTTQTDL